MFRGLVRFSGRADRTDSLPALARAKLTPSEFIKYTDAIKRLSDLIRLMEERISLGLPENAIVPFRLLHLLLQAQCRTLQHINDENLNSVLAWDCGLGFPSLPSLVADAAKYAELVQLPETISLCINSFLGWTKFTEEKLRCVCNGRRGREVRVEVCFNHHLGYVEKGLLVHEFVGVRSDDAEHLSHHYGDQKRSSRQAADLMIIFDAKCVVAKVGDRMDVVSSSQESVTQFRVEEFRRRILSVLDQGL